MEVVSIVYLSKWGVAYAMRLLPGNEASQAARDKRKAEVSKKPAAKTAKTDKGWATPSKTVLPPLKTRPLKKIGVVKMVRPRARTGLQGTLEI
jgi:hypothetical protein